MWKGLFKLDRIKSQIRLGDAFTSEIPDARLGEQGRSSAHLSLAHRPLTQLRETERFSLTPLGLCAVNTQCSKKQCNAMWCRIEIFSQYNTQNFMFSNDLSPIFRLFETPRPHIRIITKV